ncbi:nucleotide sugar dehydrogenase [candidate division KSB1 bacterium]|nr:nucleotide sugar dehydrogenase [candidate division KSB1 bacterium]RQW00224.1 MAG: nucleotide sugar dehydrogenase [candidate division KSB1 bacterium]
MELKERLQNKTAKIGVIGLGYVGLPLAVEFADRGFSVLGIDNDESKIASLNNAHNYINDVEDSKFKRVVTSGTLKATISYSSIPELDVIYICVPTPFTKNKEPDVSYIESATEGIAAGLRKGHLIILKSTTFPDTTEGIVQPILEKTGLKVGTDFYLAFSPERIDPGNKIFTTATTPVVVGGVTEKCTELACLVNQQIIHKVVPVSSPKVAEMEKLLENIFRSVNIALVNEMARLCDRMGGIDIWEVVEAAATKPYGFMPFYPGPGIGGHCILIDPYYLSWKAREYDFHTQFIELAAETNENMPFYVLGLIRRALSYAGIPFHQARIFMLGVAFKKDVDDTRESPALKIMEFLMQRGVHPDNIRFNDPYVKSAKVNGTSFFSVDLTVENLRLADVVVITTDHSLYEAEFIVEHATSVVDTRNLTKNIKNNEKISKLGAGTRF